MTQQLTWREAIDKVLSASPEALHYQDICERIIKAGLRSRLGATPAATVSAQISSAIKHEGQQSPYLRVAKGIYAWRTSSLAASTPTEAASPPNDASAAERDETDGLEAQYAVVSSFGMFWRKDAVEWSATPKLLGMQQIGAKPVNFHDQRGIYLLYDGREVIYVGRATERALGKRLYEHTVDRLATRWDRFSWFGLLPVSDNGKLGELPDSFAAAKLIPAMEAILIEALEPRQNRKRGDDLAAVEYLQKTDPEIENRKAMALVAKALKGTNAE